MEILIKQDTEYGFWIVQYNGKEATVNYAEMLAIFTEITTKQENGLYSMLLKDPIEAEKIRDRMIALKKMPYM